MINRNQIIHPSISLSTQGAHVFRWQPSGISHPILFCSSKALFEEGKSIRGGIPICWPWFGPKEGNVQHGFARTAPWKLISEHQEGDLGNITLMLEYDDLTLLKWPHKFRLIYEVEYDGTNLKISLTSHNLDDHAFEISQALHTYFYVGDVSNFAIEGLENVAYLDKVDANVKKIQSGPICVSEETDRIYLACPNLKLIDKVLQRTIEISSSGASSIVMWNPWIEKCAAIKDMTPNEYKNFICIETSNADQKILIPAQESYHLSATYQIMHGID